MKTRTKIPMRQCTGCREMKSKKEMIRVLRTSENEIILDATGKKNGRGAYLCFSEECLEKAIKNHGLERSLKMAVPDEVYQNLKRSLDQLKTIRFYHSSDLRQSRKNSERRIFHREIRKTGKGFLALVADDASENTKKKFRNMCTYYEVPLYFLSDKESLGRAMGKEFRASLAVQDENFAKAIMKALEKESGR